MKQIAEGDNMKIGIISEKKIGLLITTTIFILCSILPILFPIDFETKTVIIVILLTLLWRLYQIIALFMKLVQLLQKCVRF